MKCISLLHITWQKVIHPAVLDLWGYSNLVWTGVCCSSFKTHTHFQTSKGHFGQKRYTFLGFISKYRPNFHKLKKKQTYVLGYICRKCDACLGILWKSNHSSGTSLYASICEYPRGLDHSSHRNLVQYFLLPYITWLNALCTDSSFSEKGQKIT